MRNLNYSGIYLIENKLNCYYYGGMMGLKIKQRWVENIMFLVNAFVMLFYINDGNI